MNKLFFHLFFACIALFGFSHTVSADIATGLIGHWSFDELSGSSVFDQSSSYATGTLVNSPVRIAGRQSVGAFNFASSSTNYINFGTFSPIKNKPGVSVSLWVKFDTTLSSTDEILLENELSSSDSVIYLARYRNSITCKVRTSSTVTTSGSFTSDTARWHHIACVYDGTDVRIYANNVLINTPALQTGNTMNSNGDLTIPSNAAGGRYNKIDDVRIYDRGLSVADINEIYTYQPLSDTFPPGISSVASSTTATSSSVTWFTDEFATSQVEYGTTPSYGSFTATSSATTTNHSVDITGLTPGTTYYFRVKSVDAVGNIGTSSQYSFISQTAYVLNISKTGLGTVVGAGIDCGADCSELMLANGTTSLTAYANPGYLFTGWSGGGCSGTGICLFTATASSTVTATFNQGGVVSTGNSITQSAAGVNITWQFNCNGRPCKYGQFVTGDYWVVPIDDLNANTTHVTLTNILPASSTDDVGALLTNGAEINPVFDEYQGIISSYGTYLASRNIMNQLPYLVSPGSSIFKGIVSATTTATNTPVLSNAKCRQAPGCVVSSAVLTVLSSIPTDNGLSVFRPPFYGTWKPLFSTYNVKPERLPSSSVISSELGVSFLSEVTRIKNTWSVPQYELGTFSDGFRDLVPAYAMSNYAAIHANAYNYDVLLMFGSEYVLDKLPAIYSLMQRGIDKYGMFVDDVAFGSGAGQRLGKKPPIVFFASLYDDQTVIDNIRVVAASTTVEARNVFQEDSQIKVGVGGVPIWGDTDNGGEDDYWKRYFLEWKSQNGRTNAGSDANGAMLDPYGYIDGPPGGPVPTLGSGRTYQPVSSPALMQFAFLQLLMPWFKYANSDTQIIDYMDRFHRGYGVAGFSGGYWSAPDPCAGLDVREADICEPGGSGCTYYRVTWGPDPANPGQCLRHSANPLTTGNGRWPGFHGTSTGGSNDIGGVFDTLYDSMRVCLDSTQVGYRQGLCSNIGPEISSDTTGPVVSAVSIVPGTTTVAVTWTTNELATSTVQYGTTLSYGLASSSSALALYQSFTISGLNPETTYNIRLLSRDVYGNTSTSSNYSFTTGTQTVVSTPTTPVISSITARSGGGSSRSNAATTMTVAAVFNQAGVYSSLQPFVERLSALGLISRDKMPLALSIISQKDSTERFTRDLKFGLRGNDVMNLQNILIKKGLLSGDSATGYFGSKTRDALRAYQRLEGLPATGYFGSLTRKSVEK